MCCIQDVKDGESRRPDCKAQCLRPTKSYSRGLTSSQVDLMKTDAFVATLFVFHTFLKLYLVALDHKWHCNYCQHFSTCVSPRYWILAIIPIPLIPIQYLFKYLLNGSVIAPRFQVPFSCRVSLTMWARKGSLKCKIIISRCTKAVNIHLLLCESAVF